MTLVDSLLVALSGFVVVFCMLALLACAITLTSKVFIALEKKAHHEAPVVATPAPVASAPVAGGMYTGEVALIDVDEKTAACVMAIVSHETGIVLNELIFKKIKLLGDE